MASKFGGVLKAAKDRETEAVEATSEQEAPPSPAPAPAKLKAKTGRPAAKRSNDDFVQATAYIQKKTHTGVKIALLKGSVHKDFSELVDALLREWLKTNA